MHRILFNHRQFRNFNLAGKAAPTFHVPAGWSGDTVLQWLLFHSSTPGTTIVPRGGSPVVYERALAAHNVLGAWIILSSVTMLWLHLMHEHHDGPLLGAMSRLILGTITLAVGTLYVVGRLVPTRLGTLDLVALPKVDALNARADLVWLARADRD